MQLKNMFLQREVKFHLPLGDKGSREKEEKKKDEKEKGEKPINSF